MNIKSTSAMLIFIVTSIAHTGQPRPVLTPTPSFSANRWHEQRLPNFQGQPCIVPRPVYDHKTKTLGSDTSVPGIRCVVKPSK